MVSLELTVGPWVLSFGLGKAEEPVAVVRLSDLSEIAEAEEDDPEVSFGFGVAGEHGPELLTLPACTAYRPGE